MLMCAQNPGIETRQQDFAQLLELLGWILENAWKNVKGLFRVLVFLLLSKTGTKTGVMTNPKFFH
jgi:hypothetical protein